MIPDEDTVSRYGRGLVAALCFVFGVLFGLAGSCWINGCGGVVPDFPEGGAWLPLSSPHGEGGKGEAMAPDAPVSASGSSGAPHPGPLDPCPPWCPPTPHSQR